MEKKNCWNCKHYVFSMIVLPCCYCKDCNKWERRNYDDSKCPCCPKCGSEDYVEVEEGIKCPFCGQIDDRGDKECSMCRRSLDDGIEVVYGDGEVWEVE